MKQAILWLPSSCSSPAEQQNCLEHYMEGTQHVLGASRPCAINTSNVTHTCVVTKHIHQIDAQAVPARHHNLDISMSMRGTQQLSYAGRILSKLRSKFLFEQHGVGHMTQAMVADCPAPFHLLPNNRTQIKCMCPR